MRTQVAKTLYEVAPFFGSPLDSQPKDDGNNGNWNPPPALNLQLRPISVQSDWGPASYKDSRLPSSLKEWLDSGGALIIGRQPSEEPTFAFRI